MKLILAAAFAFTLSAQQRVDVLLRGGAVVDGTGAPGRPADVGLTGNRIAFIGNASAPFVRTPLRHLGLVPQLRSDL